MIGDDFIGVYRRLLRNILAVPELGGTTFAFNDISQRNFDIVKQLCQRATAANWLADRMHLQRNGAE